MSFSFISRISLYLSFLFIFSCQDTISSLRNNENIDSDDYTYQLETEEFLDFSFFVEILLFINLSDEMTSIKFKFSAKHFFA